MQYLVTSSEMKHYDTYTSQKVGIPSMVLMERAALAVIEQLNTGQFDLHKVAVVCGYGNNGGDGVAVARLLKLKQISVVIYFVGNPNHCSPETLQQIKIAQHYEIPITTSLSDSFTGYTTIVDAIFGIGLDRTISGDFYHIIQLINQSRADVLSIDIPSGISADTGKILGIAVKAKQTVTFAYKKIGLVLYPGTEFAGDIHIADIGIYADELPDYYTYTADTLINLLPNRSNYSNKGSFGKVLVIAGSENISGAAFLAAKAAYRTGAGLVRIYTPECNRNILLNQLPEALLTTYISNQIDKAQLDEVINWASVIVIGPGIGVSDNTHKILSTVLKQAKIPVIIDADGLNILAQDLKLLTQTESTVIVTPHLGEMARLTNKTIADIADNLIASAQAFAEQFQVICVMKDARTIVATPYKKTYINQSGNNGMATGGTGDVLTGIMAGLIAQHLPPRQSAPVSVYLHGLAGDAAVKKLNKYSLLASDIIASLTNILSV
ncbi:bifunctional ADP-dependent NAD(P)H-hydrate dehydratase/NAD(P)H-hydrate epimerase [Gilliamella sp. wkB112]|uniref:bifunctional ADP-dependent NAD(P)H-hydrate dehydratase/NAD(P)H-hydrate epimerase n=1 Tax=Gilliamella sp. wkB112 TaxID=3120257 RepID=UPI00080E6F8D|nr:bifunctional ADP-dependent NAD(P)H-hydrate dehydratase/NAD(P)H-hydrate epimerase [Gilliamella apicola]OCG03964.1 hypothetical protein A9G12_07285 [Gilliamella apicola]